MERRGGGVGLISSRFVSPHSLGGELIRDSQNCWKSSLWGGGGGGGILSGAAHSELSIYIASPRSIVDDLMFCNRKYTFGTPS